MDRIKTLSGHIVEFYEKLSSWENTIVRGTELSPAQIHTLEIIGESQGLKMKEIADRMGVTTGTVTVMIDRLEDKGLVERQRHESDRRSYRIVLTEKGERYHDDHHSKHLRLTEELASALEDTELEQFSLLLGKIIERF